jgi:putative transposase
MSSEKNTFVSGNYYHVFNRGVNREDIFFSKENYLYCQRLIEKYSQTYHITIIAYCLMPNHYHLLARQDDNIRISKLIKVVFNAYVQGVNKQIGRQGTLFEARPKHVHVDKDEYILHLCRYIHLNPVKARLVDSPDQWEFSNYLEWIDERQCMLKNAESISTYFANPQDYKRFVIEYKTEEWLKKKLQHYILE